MKSMMKNFMPAYTPEEEEHTNQTPTPNISFQAEWALNCPKTTVTRSSGYSSSKELTFYQSSNMYGVVSAILTYDCQEIT